MERLEALKHCSVLSGFSDVGLQILAAVARERYYPKSQALQAQGELPRDAGLVILVSGRARCEVRDGDDKVLGLGTLSGGDHLGAMRLFGDAKSPVTVIAETEVNALVIDRAAFARVQKQKPNTAAKLLFALAQDFGRRLGETSKVFAEFAVFAGVKANLAERGNYASYSELGLDKTPTLKGIGNSLKE